MFKNILKRKNISLYIVSIFFITLLIHLIFSFLGIGNDLNNMYGFRQNQTAISTFYLVKEGIKLNYITPVLGAPWSIPMEFPIYQWLVAIVTIITKINLDTAGRLVSIAFFYLSLIPSYLILKIYIKKKINILILLSIILASPVYIFWSRSFMIESTALFFSLLFLLYVLYFQIKSVKLFLFLGIVSGILAGLTKTTTFVPFFILAGLLFLFDFLKKYQFKYSYVLNKAFSGLLLFGIPISISYMWTKYADNVKNLNPLAENFITSNALLAWNFGTLSQKLSLSTWKQIFSHTLYNLTSFNILTTILLLLIVSIPIILRMKYYKHILVLIFAYFIGPLIFTNLYFVHHYYYYANVIFLLAALGFAIISLIESKKTNLVFLSFFFASLIFTNFYLRYFSYYLPIQMSNNNNIREASSYIKSKTNDTDIILVYGYDWDSTLPYYSERKAIMIRGSSTETDPSISKSINNIEKNSMKLMAVYKAGFPLKNKFIKERARFYNLNLKPVVINDFEIYSK